MTDLIICPLCATVIHRHIRTDVTTRIRVPSNSSDTASVMQELWARAQAEQRAEAETAERACVEHYQDRHRFRYWLWRHFRRSWILTRPEREYRHVMPEDQAFTPMQFLEKT